MCHVVKFFPTMGALFRMIGLRAEAAEAAIEEGDPTLVRLCSDVSSGSTSEISDISYFSNCSTTGPPPGLEYVEVS